VAILSSILCSLLHPSKSMINIYIDVGHSVLPKSFIVLFILGLRFEALSWLWRALCFEVWWRAGWLYTFYKLLEEINCLGIQGYSKILYLFYPELSVSLIFQKIKKNKIFLSQNPRINKNKNLFKSIVIAENKKTSLKSLALLFHFLCAQHVSDINISIIRSLRLFCWLPHW